MRAGAPSASVAIGLSRANLVRAIRLPRSGTASGVIPEHWPRREFSSLLVNQTPATLRTPLELELERIEPVGDRGAGTVEQRAGLSNWAVVSFDLNKTSCYVAFQ